MIIQLTEKDNALIAKTKQLWHNSFGDSTDSIERYYAVRSSACNIVCNIVNGEVVSMLHAIPCRIITREKAMDVRLLSAICTHRDYRNMGFASELIRVTHNIINADAFLLQPANDMLIPFYERLGYSTLTHCRRYTFSKPEQINTIIKTPSPERLIRIFREYAGHFPAYTEMCERDLHVLSDKSVYPDTFFACTDNSFAFCENGDVCTVLFTCGRLDSELLLQIFAQTKCRKVDIITSEKIENAKIIPFNMIRTEHLLPENVYSYLYY